MNNTEPVNRADLASRYRTTVFIIAGQIILTVISFAAVWLLAPKPATAVTRQTLTTLWAAVIFLAVGALVLRRMFFRWDRLKDITILRGMSGLLRKLQVNAIILASFAAVLSFVGCAIFFLTGEIVDMARAGTVALIVYFINFPRRAMWEKIVAVMEKV